MKKLAKAVGADLASEQSLRKYTGRRTAPTRDEIAQLAFSFYESRGWQDGHDIEDWVRAEQELVRRYA